MKLVRRIGDEVKLLPIINSSGDDFYYITHGLNALLSSNRAEGRGDDDIYYMQLPQPYTPLTTVPILTIKLEGSICLQTDYVIRSYQGGVVRDSLEFNTRGVKGPVTIQKSLCPTKP
jgi:hypothetical protein